MLDPGASSTNQWWEEEATWRSLAQAVPCAQDSAHTLLAVCFSPLPLSLLPEMFHDSQPPSSSPLLTHITTRACMISVCLLSSL